MMTGAIKKSLKDQIQTSEKGTNTELVYAQIQKNEHIVTFLQTLREYGSKKITKYQSTLSPSKSQESL